jgi:hypothetical protein
MSDFRELVEMIQENAVRNAIVSLTADYEDIGEPVEALKKVARNFDLEYNVVVKKYYELLEA